MTPMITPAALKAAFDDLLKWAPHRALPPGLHRASKPYLCTTCGNLIHSRERYLRQAYLTGDPNAPVIVRRAHMWPCFPTTEAKDAN